MKKITIQIDKAKRKRIAKRRLESVGHDVMTHSFQCAVEEAVKAQQEKSLPVAKFDLERNQVYYLYADGSRVYEKT